MYIRKQWLATKLIWTFYIHSLHMYLAQLHKSYNYYILYTYITTYFMSLFLYICVLSVNGNLLTNISHAVSQDIKSL